MAYSVCLSTMPSLLQSTSFIILPCPGFLPREPIISTPTYTSPDAATARQAGLGVRLWPEKPMILRSPGQFNLADMESIDDSDGSLGCGSQTGCLLLHPIASRITKNRVFVFFIISGK